MPRRKVDKSAAKAQPAARRKTKDRAPRHQLVPRKPGLWLAHGQTEADRVDEAERHLVKVLRDPYNAEAFQRLSRKKHPAVAKIPGRLPDQVGMLAAHAQWRKPKARRKGRPESAHNWEAFVSAVEAYRTRTGERLSWPEAVRRMLRGLFPRAKPYVIRQRADDVAQYVRDHLKRRRRKAGK